MRGAALKIGQMLSIQDETVLPPQVCCLIKHLVGGRNVRFCSQCGHKMRQCCRRHKMRQVYCLACCDLPIVGQ
jgi:hypothetical protein